MKSGENILFVANRLDINDYLTINKGLLGMGEERKLKFSLNPHTLKARQLATEVDLSSYLEARDQTLISRLNSIQEAFIDDAMAFIVVKEIDTEIKIIEAERGYLATLASALLGSRSTT